MAKIKCVLYEGYYANYWCPKTIAKMGREKAIVVISLQKWETHSSTA